MADQVNPIGSLAPGTAQTLKVTVKPPPSSEKPRPAQGPDSRSNGPEGRVAGVSATSLDALDEALKKVDNPDEAQTQAEALNDAAKTVEDFLQQTPSDLVFKVDKATGIPFFKIVDSVTHEVVRQIPAEEILAMARKLRELSGPQDASGVLMDEEG
jgi:flagellar protein FlaG